MLNLRKGTELRERYVVHDVVGTGGSASVWKASDKQLNRDVALKRLLKPGTTSNDEQMKALLEEARKNAILVHTNIVQVYDIIEVDGENLLVMEFVSGQSLANLLREKASCSESIPLDVAISLLRDILLGLSFAHANNICHRDLSPMNILLTAQHVPKIADFGIARVLNLAHDMASTPQAGTCNPNFMSPEQARGEAADTSSDLFMIGIIGYLLLSGRHPFVHPSGLFTISELLQDETFTPDTPRPPGTLTSTEQRLFREYAAIVMMLLTRERVGRFASARKAIDAIDAVAPSIDCPQCGEKVPDHHRYCGYCGSALRVSPPPELDLSQPVSRNADQLCEEGYQLSRLRLWDGAVEKYREALQLDPNHLTTLWNLGFVLNRIGHHSEADAVLSRALEQGKRDHRAALFYERGVARWSQKKYEDALADIEDSLQLQRDSIKARFLRARTYLELGKVDDARRDAKTILEAIPDHTGALRLLQNYG